MTDAAEIPLVTKHNPKKSSENCNMIFRRRFLIGVAIVFLTALALSAYILTNAPIFNQYELIRQHRPDPRTPAPRTMLLWNSFFGDKRWSLPEDTLGPDYFRQTLQCPVYDCEITNVPYFLPEITMFDAILFHTAEPFPIWNSIPLQRDVRQLYVFALMEPPSETKHVLGDEKNFYNLTMTYRLDSDIVWPYQYVVDVETGALVAPAQYPHWRQPPDQWNDTQIWSLLETKTKLAAWFVSHCKTLSRREELVAKLAKFVDVDIFGKCGNMSCTRDSDICDQMLDQQYKFYLSFENAHCTDYVSEKFFNALKRQIVPVVFGGANYTQFAPPHSYIDANNFDTVEELAQYLNYLNEHPAEYMRYFWWRQYYRLDYQSPFCDLCEKLHSITYRQKTQTYRNIEKWWLDYALWFESDIKF